MAKPNRYKPSRSKPTVSASSGLKSNLTLGDHERFYIRVDSPRWVEVTEKEWIQAERDAGFVPKLSSTSPKFMTTRATAGFSKSKCSDGTGKEIWGTIRKSFQLPENADKGMFKGSCNRTACQAPNATNCHMDNHRGLLFYCDDCTFKINADSKRFDGFEIIRPALDGVYPFPPNYYTTETNRIKAEQPWRNR